MGGAIRNDGRFGALRIQLPRNATIPVNHHRAYSPLKLLTVTVKADLATLRHRPALESRARGLGVPVVKRVRRCVTEQGAALPCLPLPGSTGLRNNSLYAAQYFGLRLHTNDAVNLAAGLEHQQGWNTPNVKALRGYRVLIHIQFGNSQAPRQLCC
jgi:hypothetical protein